MDISKAPSNVEPIEVRPDDDPTQDLMLQVLAAVAEFEAKITQQRVREGSTYRFIA